GTTMIGPGEIGASLFNFIYFAWLGTLGFMFLAVQNFNKHKNKFYFGLCLFLLILLNIAFELKTSFTCKTISGITLALLGGTSSFIYFKQSQSLAKNATLSATQILAVRFYLSIFILLLLVPKHGFENYLTFNNLIY